MDWWPQRSMAQGTEAARLLCRKCAHPNSVNNEVCEKCGHSLYVLCHCGALNARTNRNCGQCGDQLRSRRLPVGTFQPPEGTHSAAADNPSNDLVAALIIIGAIILILVVIGLLPAVEERYIQEHLSVRSSSRSFQCPQEIASAPKGTAYARNT